MNNDDLLETLKITIELVRKLNNEKRDYNFEEELKSKTKTKRR